MSLKELNKIKKYYQDGAWSKTRLDVLLEKGKLTQAEYDYIVS